MRLSISCRCNRTIPCRPWFSCTRDVSPPIWDWKCWLRNLVQNTLIKMQLYKIVSSKLDIELNKSTKEKIVSRLMREKIEISLTTNVRFLHESCRWSESQLKTLTLLELRNKFTRLGLSSARSPRATRTSLIDNLTRFIRINDVDCRVKTAFAIPEWPCPNRQIAFCKNICYGIEILRRKVKSLWSSFTSRLYCP